MDYDEDLIGEAPCEFCGEPYPLMILIEHQSTHLVNDDYDPYQDEQIQAIIEETRNAENKPEVIFEFKQQFSAEPKVAVAQNQQSSSKNQPEKNILENQQSVIDQTKTSNESSKTSSKQSYPEYNDETVNIGGCKRRRILSNNKYSDGMHEEFDMCEKMKSDDEDDDEINIIQTKLSTENTAAEQTQSSLFSKTLKDIKKFPEQKGKEFSTEKGEKLLVYGDEIDPDKELENEKQAYKMPNNPLLNSIQKNEDIEDINNLSDDDCSESLEEFWKRARDFLKKNKRIEY